MRFFIRVLLLISWSRVRVKRRLSSSASAGTRMPVSRPAANCTAIFMESRLSVFTRSREETSIDAAWTTRLRIPLAQRTRCSTKPENPASYAE